MVKTYVKNAAAIMAVATIASFGMMVSADSGYTHTRTLKVGSRGLAVESLQEALNSCWDAGLVADGIFGKGVKAAVKAAQMDLGLTADGIVGKISGKGIANCEPMDSEETDDTTDTTTTPPDTTTSTTITGPEGNLSNITKLGSYNNTKVSESNADVKVYGLEVTAKDGDQKIDGITLAFKNTGTGSTKITKYASEISIWLDGKEIGRKVAAAYSDDTSDIYTYRFSGMNGIVKKDMKSQLVVAVSGVSSMDSTDATGEIWMVEAGTVVSGTNTNYLSAMSANGRFRDFGGDLSTSTIDFQKAGGSSSDQKFKVTVSTTNPVAQNVQVSSTADTSDKMLLAFDIKAENGAMKVQKLPVTLSVVDGTTDGTAPYTNALVKSLKLYANGIKIADESVPQDGLDSALETIIFGNSSKLQYKIDANTTVKFEVRADFNDTENNLYASSTCLVGTNNPYLGCTGVGTGTPTVGSPAIDFDNGDGVVANYSSANVLASTVELDNFNQDTVSNRSGSATGELQTLRSNGAVATMGTVTTTYTGPSYSGDVSNKAIFNIPVTVTAFEDTIYVGQSLQAVAAAGITGTNAFSFTLNDSATPTTQSTTTATGTVTTTISSNATTSGSAWILPAGQSKTFTIQVIVTGATAAKNYRVQLNDLKFFTDAALTQNATVQNLVPMSTFQTVYSPVF